VFSGKKRLEVDTTSIAEFGNKTARRVKFSEIAIGLLPERSNTNLLRLSVQVYN